MQLPEISIRRPVFATVLSLLVLLVGLVSFTRLAVREYPKIDEPMVTVTTRYPGASAEVIESQVTKPLEDSIAGIDAVDVITSISRKRTEIWLCSARLMEVMTSTASMPAMESSSGLVTCDSITSADAPG